MNKDNTKIKLDHMIYEEIFCSAEPNIHTIIELIDQGADVHTKSPENKLPLLNMAIFRELNKIAKLLIDKGADINLGDPLRGHTPLFSAVIKGNLEIVKLLLQNSNIQVNKKNFAGVTPLHFIAQINIVMELNKNRSLEELLEIAKLLLAVPNIEVNIYDNELITPMHHAASSGMVEINKLLIDKGGDVKLPDKHGITPLHLGISKGCVEVIKILTSHIQNLEFTDENIIQMERIARNSISEREAKDRILNFILRNNLLKDSIKTVN